jgi:hypothetical protein
MSAKDKFDKQVRGIYKPKKRIATIADIERLGGGGGGGGTWASITGKPTGFPPSAHTHAISEVTGLSAALASIGGAFTLDDGTAAAGGAFTFNDGAA